MSFLTVTLLEKKTPHISASVIEGGHPAQIFATEAILDVRLCPKIHASIPVRGSICTFISSETPATQQYSLSLHLE